MSGGPLAGRRVLVSAGPTYEDLDPVRFLGNRSSGKMGFAIAAEAARRGAHTVLVAGPVALATPAGVDRRDVRSAAQMHAAVLQALPADVYIGAAAVADFTPARVATGKIKKQPGHDGLVLELVRTADILAGVAAHAQRPRLVVGFAAETEDLEANARGKLERKRLDLIVANDVSAPGVGFEHETNAVTLLRADGGRREVALASKRDVARAILDEVVALRATGDGAR